MDSLTLTVDEKAEAHRCAVGQPAEAGGAFQRVTDGMAKVQYRPASDVPLILLHDLGFQPHALFDQPAYRRKGYVT